MLYKVPQDAWMEETDAYNLYSNVYTMCTHHTISYSKCITFIYHSIFYLYMTLYDMYHLYHSSISYRPAPKP